MWGVVPAAGRASRIQPLAFSKELLPVGSRLQRGIERPCAVSEYLLDRMVAAGATRICFVISPNKTDIMEYFGSSYGPASICYVVQARPNGLCDAVFSAAPFVPPEENVLIGLPDTVWFPRDAFASLPPADLSLLLFPVSRPEFFDAVCCDRDGSVSHIEVKSAKPSSNWIWGGMRMTGATLLSLQRLWLSRVPRDEYLGTLINEWMARGGCARGVFAGSDYVDVGTFGGYRAALTLLAERSGQEEPSSTSSCFSPNGAPSDVSLA